MRLSLISNIWVLRASHKLPIDLDDKNKPAAQHDVCSHGLQCMKAQNVITWSFVVIVCWLNLRRKCLRNAWCFPKNSWIIVLIIPFFTARREFSRVYSRHEFFLGGIHQWFLTILNFRVRGRVLLVMKLMHLEHVHGGTCRCRVLSIKYLIQEFWMLRTTRTNIICVSITHLLLFTLCS
jgi:hypothetical protein